MPIRRLGPRHTPAASFSLPRRRFMQSSALAGAAAAVGLPAFSARAAGSGTTVAIIGNGAAALTAAQELAERGFHVSVYGHTRSTGTGGRLDLSADHDFGNLLDAQPSPTMLAAGGQDAYLNHAVSFPASADGLPAAIQSWLQDAFVALDIPVDELAFFVSKFHVFMASSEARRLQQWEHMSWWDYVGAANRSANYQRLIGRAPLTDAARSKNASARSVGRVLEAFFHADARQGYADGAIDAPSIDAWCQHLAGLGVSLNPGVQAAQFQYANGQVTGLLVHVDGHTHTIHTHWYVVALPAAKVAALMPAAMLEAGRQFAHIAKLTYQRSVGVQFLLAQAARIHQGCFACLHSPWAVTGILQSHSLGTVQKVLSLKVSDLTTPGMLYGLPAHQCTREQIAQEALAQLRHDLPNGHSVLPDSAIQSWTIAVDADPQLIDTVGSWPLRPETSTAIPNVFLAGDYVRAANANESGRRAANAIVAASGSSANPATIYPRYTSPLLTPHLMADAVQFAAGRPHRFDRLDPYYPNCHV